MRLRRFTDHGIEQFRTYLDALRRDPRLPPPRDLLKNDSICEDVEPAIEVEERAFENRLSAAEYLFNLFKHADLPATQLDKGLWSWLALFYFDCLCPPAHDGRRKPKEDACYIPDQDNFRRYYRHLLAGPYLIYSAHHTQPEIAMALLCQPVHIIDDVVEQIAAHQALVSNQTVVEVATRLYYVPGATRPKRGAGGKGPGSARRLVGILNQLDVTYDLPALTADELLKLLPEEFDRFAKTSA